MIICNRKTLKIVRRLIIVFCVFVCAFVIQPLAPEMNKHIYVCMQVFRLSGAKQKRGPKKRALFVEDFFLDVSHALCGLLFSLVCPYASSITELSSPVGLSEC